MSSFMAVTHEFIHLLCLRHLSNHFQETLMPMSDLRVLKLGMHSALAFVHFKTC